MSRRQSFLAYVALLAGVIAFASSFARPTAGQQGPDKPTGEGRYQVAAAGDRYSFLVFVTDSATGRTWSKDVKEGNAQWVDLGSPIPAK